MSTTTTPYRSIARRGLKMLAILTATASLPALAVAQAGSGVLTSRAELAAAESSASQGGDSQKGALVAAAIRQRLRDGDFQVGDRVIVTVVANTTRTDTMTVRSGRILELPGKLTIPLAGVLRSELRDRVSAEILKYVKADEIIVTPLMRVGILGEVARPGYFAFASDMPITDAIMGAGGPSPTADLDRSVVKRGNHEIRSSKDTRAAIARGLTLDQFGLSAGDELVVGRRKELISPAFLGVLGVLGSLVTLSVALNHR